MRVLSFVVEACLFGETLTNLLGSRLQCWQHLRSHIALADSGCLDADIDRGDDLALLAPNRHRK